MVKNLGKAVKKLTELTLGLRVDVVAHNYSAWLVPEDVLQGGRKIFKGPRAVRKHAKTNDSIRAESFPMPQ